MNERSLEYGCKVLNRCKSGCGMGNSYGSAGANNYSGSRVRFKSRVLNIRPTLL